MIQDIRFDSPAIGGPSSAGNRRLFLVPMYEDEVLEERSAWAALLKARIVRLGRFLISNYQMLLSCATVTAARRLAKRIQQLHESIGVLTCQLLGEVTSAAFHAQAASLDAVWYRLVVAALKRASGQFKLDADEAFRLADEVLLAELAVKDFGRGVWS